MILRQNPRTTLQKVGDDLLVLNRDKEQVHQLNETAAYIYERCDGSTPVASIVDGLANEYAIDSATAERDVAAALEQLQALALLLPGDH